MQRKRIIYMVLILGLLGLSWGFIGSRSMITTSVGWMQSDKQEEPSPKSAASLPDIPAIIAQLPRLNEGVNQTNWNLPQYEMILITPSQVTGFVTAAEEYAAWKTKRGLPTKVVANYSNYDGLDGPEKIRNTIKWYYDRYPIQYVLLLGDTSLLPIRNVYNPDVQIVGDHEASPFDNIQKPTDYYYAELTADWNIDGDANWGEDRRNNTESDESELDYDPEVSVGRFPADTLEELQNMLEKTRRYEEGLDAGDWSSQYLAVSGISDWPGADDLDGEDEAVVNQYIIDEFIDDQMNWTHLLQHTSYYTPKDDPRVENLNRTRALELLNQGVSIFTYAGHGSPIAFQAASVLTTADVPGLINTHRLPLIFADACSTNSFDIITDACLGEQMIKRAETGAIGYIGALRLSWYYPNDTIIEPDDPYDTFLEQDNRALARLYFEAMFHDGFWEQGKALYESKRRYAASEWFQWGATSATFDYFEMERKSLLTYALLGDPSVQIMTAIPQPFFPLDVNGSELIEGMLLHTRITTDAGEGVPYAKLTFQTVDQKTRVFTADTEGFIDISFPSDETELTYMLVGHNMLPLEGNLTLIPDTSPPEILGPIVLNPIVPTSSDLVQVSISSCDNESGVNEVYFVLSTDGFVSIQSYVLHLTSTQFQYTAEIGLLEYATYEYGIIVFDRANNYNSTFIISTLPTLTVPAPTQLLVLQISVYVLLGIGAIVIIAMGFAIWKSREGS